jgi:hypothetical protein
LKWTLQPCILLERQRAGHAPQKLYLNLKISQVGSQLVWRLVVNNGKAEAAGAFEIERAVVDENTFLGPPLGDSKSDAEDAFFRFARVNVAGAEENLKAFAEIESFDAVLIQFEWFIVDGTDEILPGLHYGVENGTGAGKFLGLREHESGEFFTSELARAIEEGAVEIFVDGDLPGVERGESEIVAVLEFFVIDVEDFAGGFAGIAIPAVGENDAADVPE